MKRKKALKTFLMLMTALGVIILLVACQIPSGTDIPVIAYEPEGSTQPTAEPAHKNQIQEDVITIIEHQLAHMMVQTQIEGSTMTGFDFEGKLELGRRLNAYRYEYVLEAIDDICWYPILEDGRIVAIVSLHGDPQAPTTTMRVEFALELQNAIDNGACTFALMFKGVNLYVVTAEDKTVLWTYGIPTMNTPEARLSDKVVEMQFSSVEALHVLIPPVDVFMQIHN